MRKVDLHVKISEEIWIKLSIRFPIFYPMAVAPVITIESCSKMVRVSQSDILQILVSLSKQSTGIYEPCLRKIIGSLTNELGNTVKYPTCIY